MARVTDGGGVTLAHEERLRAEAALRIVSAYARLLEMVDGWEADFPDMIRTGAACAAVRNVIERHA